jgi:phage-related protein
MGVWVAWTVEYYQDERGRYPVREFLDTLPESDQARILQTARLLEEFGLQLGAPYVKAVRRKLWELRVRAGRARYRILYFAFVGQRFILLHGFVKKTAKIPRREIKIAEQRMADFIARQGVEE